MNPKFLLLLALLGFCHGAVGQETQQVEGASDQVAEAPPENYVIQQADVLRMQVYQEPDLMQEFRIPQNGMVQLPLIGAVNLKGKTVAEAEKMIHDLYNADYLVNPQINLLILEFSQRRVNVLGAVNAPGTVLFPPDEEMTLLDAISRAGGFNRLARKSGVILTRIGRDGEPVRYRVNVEALIQGGADSTLWTLEKDDTIYVPERIF